jgi:ribonucleotide reductase beta subunit family protein with ferritin-like domain
MQQFFPLKKKEQEEIFNEPLLVADDSKYSILPVTYPDIMEMYKKAVSSFWVEEECNFSKDLNDWNNKLNDNERYFISMILAFFAGSDGLINENLGLRFYNDVQNSEARLFYGFQITMEGIHGETYAKIIDTYIRDKKQKQDLFNAMSVFPCIKRKADWCKKHIASDKSFAERLVCFACVEGIAFSGAFCSIFWLKKRALLQGLTFSNELISRDEALHTEFAILLYSKLINKLSFETIKEIIMEMVDIECEFITEAIPCRMIGMNADSMIEYIKFVADRLSLQLGYDKIYNVKNPFNFMEMISLESKTNFFENKVSDYALATKDIADDCFELKTDF